MDPFTWLAVSLLAVADVRLPTGYDIVQGRYASITITAKWYRTCQYVQNQNGFAQVCPATFKVITPTDTVIVKTMIFDRSLHGAQPGDSICCVVDRKRNMHNLIFIGSNGQDRRLQR